MSKPFRGFYPNGFPNQYIKFRMKKRSIFTLIALVAIFVALAVTACKATRTVTSTATYTEVTDSSKVTTTISTKTVEDYQGVKKN